MTSDSRYDIQRNVLSRRRVTALLPGTKRVYNEMEKRPSSANARTCTHTQTPRLESLARLVAACCCTRLHLSHVSGKTILFQPPTRNRSDRPSRLIEEVARLVIPSFLVARSSVDSRAIRLSLEFISPRSEVPPLKRHGMYFQTGLKIRRRTLRAEREFKHGAPCRARYRVYLDQWWINELLVGVVAPKRLPWAINFMAILA